MNKLFYGTMGVVMLVAFAVGISLATAIVFAVFFFIAKAFIGF